MEVTREELIEALEEMARQHCYTDATGETCAALSADATALSLLARAGRFRISWDGRIVKGYWPENDPEGKA